MTSSDCGARAGGGAAAGGCGARAGGGAAAAAGGRRAAALAGHERTVLGLLVICAAGVMEAYSYLMHGEVFANGQTGNVVLFVLSLARGERAAALGYLVPICAFVGGVFLSGVARDALLGGDQRRMQRSVLWGEAVLFVGLAAVSGLWCDLAVNSVISFAAAVLLQNFRTLEGDTAFASVFCSGNLRALGASLYDGFVRGCAVERRRAARYAALIAAFGTGVLLGKLACDCAGDAACAATSAILLLATCLVGGAGAA